MNLDKIKSLILKAREKGQEPTLLISPSLEKEIQKLMEESTLHLEAENIRSAPSFMGTPLLVSSWAPEGVTLMDMRTDQAWTFAPRFGFDLSWHDPHLYSALAEGYTDAPVVVQQEERKLSFIECPYCGQSNKPEELACSFCGGRLRYGTQR